MELQNCKHCGQELSQINLPVENDWGVDHLLVCMNDECGYYVRGWEWMLNKYKAKASYRFQRNTYSGYEGPFPVKTPEDYKDCVVK